MTLRRCQTCTALFAVGLDVCPQCGGSGHHEEGSSPSPVNPSRADLVATAHQMGLTVPKGRTKAQIQQMIDEATQGTRGA